MRFVASGTPKGSGPLEPVRGSRLPRLPYIYPIQGGKPMTLLRAQHIIAMSERRRREDFIIHITWIGLGVWGVVLLAFSYVVTFWR